MATIRKGSIIGFITEGGSTALSVVHQKPGNPSALIRNVDGQDVVVIERADIDDVIDVLKALKK